MIGGTRTARVAQVVLELLGGGGWRLLTPKEYEVAASVAEKTEASLAQ